MHTRTAILFLLSIALATEVQAGTMAWSLVGNIGNSPDQSYIGNGPFGAVTYAYNIGTYDVTANQYVEFLNAKDPGGLNQLGLYNNNMSNAAAGGVSFNNLNPAGSMYGVISGRGNHPANYTSWYDSIRFANWMNNGQGNGDTETGAYTLGTLGPGSIPVTPPLTHNAGSQIWLPTQNEWYKAAFYDPGSSSYFLYPTSSNIVPTASGPTAAPNSANYNEQNLHLGIGITDVGAYKGTTSPYGAFDMGGNVFQWNEAMETATHRGIRGGSLLYDQSFMGAPLLTGDTPEVEINDFGFRLASAPGVPEPSTLALAAFGFMALVALGWRRRKR